MYNIWHKLTKEYKIMWVVHIYTCFWNAYRVYNTNYYVKIRDTKDLAGENSRLTT